MTGGTPFLFEGYALDVACRELRRGSELISLEPQVFDLLVYVIRNRDRVVTKNDLIEAVWNGRIVSDSTLTTRINAMRRVLGDSGEEQRLIRTVARKGIRFVGVVKEGEPAIPAAPSEHASDLPVLALPDKPSIAVLPFQNMSDDPSQDYFCDGMVEEIITALSRFQWLFVIARNSSFTYKGRAVDVKQVARELGVRYVLEGSVRKAGEKVRITGQLIDATSGAHLWADRFDGLLHDVFDLQDQVSMSVVGVVEPKLRHAEMERVRQKPTESLNAYDHLLRAYPHFYAKTQENLDKALEHLNMALALDPRFVSAAGLAAACYPYRVTQGWTEVLEKDVEEGCRLARIVVDGDRGDPEALASAAFTLAYLGHHYDEALVLIDQALLLNANSFWVCDVDGWLRLYVLDCQRAVASFQKAYRLSPLDQMVGDMLSGLSAAYWLLGEYEESLNWARLSVRKSPKFIPSHLCFVASLVATDRLTEARVAANDLLRMKPSFKIDDVIRGRPYQTPARLDALRKAGLPE